MTRIPFAFVSIRLLILSCMTSLWCQQATLTGYVRDKKDNSGINGAQVVITKSNRTATSNKDGLYRMSGLQQGQKVTAVYKADGYGARRVDVTLSGVQTAHDVQLYRDLVAGAYWHEVTKSLQTSARPQGNDPRVLQIFFLKAWKDLDDSTLSPEAKATAAQEFIKLSPEGLADPEDSDAAESLRVYGRIDWNRISDAKTEFRMALTGVGTLRGKSRLVPDSVAVDIAAQLFGQVQIWPVVHKEFFGDFKDIYGARAADKLKGSMWRYPEWAATDADFWIPNPHPPKPKPKPEEKR